MQQSYRVLLGAVAEAHALQQSYRVLLGAVAEAHSLELLEQTLGLLIDQGLNLKRPGKGFDA